MNTELLDTTWVLLSAALVFLMQAGFMCLESGMTRAKNNINVAVKNLTDFAISVFLFWVCGFALMFGASHGGWLGTTGFFKSLDAGGSYAAFFLFQAMFVATAATILSGAVAERMRFGGYIIITVLVSGVLYPFFGHWAWNGADAGTSAGWLGQRGFVDFAGSTVVHSVGGWISLAALLVIGARQGRFPKGGPPKEITGSNIPVSVLGTLLLWLGWFGFNGGSALGMNDQVPKIIANTVLAGCSGALVALAIGWSVRRLPNVNFLINGSLAGLVAITAPCHAVSAASAVVIGGIGGGVMLGATCLMLRSRVDDAVGAVPVHLAAGIWGTIAVALFGDLETLGTGLSRQGQLLVQIEGILACGLWVFGLGYLVLNLIDRAFPFRVTPEDEVDGLNIAEHGATTELIDLLMVMESQKETGDLGLRVPEEPFTEVGQIARRYNQVMDSLEEVVVRTKVIVRDIRDGIITFTRKGILTSLNPGAESVFGFPADELVGQPASVLFAEGQDGLDLVLNRENERPGPDIQISENRHLLAGRRKDNSTFHMEWSLTVGTLDEEPFCTALIRDVTERVEAQEQADKYLQELLVQSAALEAAANAIIVTNPGGGILWVNQAFSRLTGYAREEVIGRNPNILNSGKHDDSFYRNLHETIHRGNVWDGEIINRRKDGTLYTEEMTITPVTDDGGEITHFIAIKQDISERKRNEKEIIDARNAAEAANQIKSEFLANMSHEIRTPMNGIIGMTELTLDTELNPQQSEYLGLVKDSAHSLLQIINEILDFSKVEAGKLTLEEIPFQFQECVSQTIKTLALRASEKGLELLCEIHPDVPRTVIGDPGRLRQVLVNLTGNAIKFTESGEVHVEVSSEGQCDGRASVHFRVRDTGIGIPSEKQASIFEAFAQADSSSTRHYGGTGLGLTISSQLASLMGGRIWVESIEGTGSTFHFTAEFEQSSGQTRFMTTRRAVALKRQKILVVDDNKTNLRILDGVLARWNKEATLIADSSLALGALKQAYEDGDPYSLLLLDCQMPGLDGFMVAEKILNNPDLNVKVIMLTSAGHRGDAARCQELGIAGYLTKPVDQSELLDAILTALGASTTPEQQPELVTRHALREAGNKGRILVAEDNEVNQKLIISILEKHGYTIVLAENGTEAVDAFEQEAFDLILMDVRMPGMDGLQATVAIRATEKGRNIPIVALTAHAMHGDREMCLEAGMTDYVTKPVQTEELLSRIQALTGRPEHDLHPPEGQEIPTVVFDESGLLERTEGDMELALEVVQVFIDNSQRLITQMEDSFTAGDARALRDAAHSIKGSAGNFGAPKAQLLAEEVQFLAAHSEISEASPKLDELKREINVLVSELEQFVNGASS